MKVARTLKCSSEILTDTFEKTVENFWGVKMIGIAENQPIFKYFCESISFDENDNRYKVKHTFKEFLDIIHDKFENCKGRFNSLKKKFTNNKHLLSEYKKIIRNQLQPNVIEKLDNHINESQAGQIHCLPHRPVIRNNKKKMSKVRIVYDASLKIKNSPSLNNCSLPDPSLRKSLFRVLIPFHFKNICIFCRYCKGIPASYIG